MYMGDDYYKSKIERYERSRAIAALAMNVCVSYITFKNDREKRKLTDGIYLLQNVDMAKAQKGRKKIQDVIKKLKRTGYVSIFDVEKSIDERERKYRLDLDYTEKHKIADDISDGPVEALSDYARKYMEAKQAILRVDKEQEEDKKREAERKKKEEEQETRRESYDSGYSSRSYSSYTEEERTTSRPYSGRSYSSFAEEEKKPARPRPYSATTAEASKELIKEDIDKRIASKYGTHGFTYEEKEKIKQLYPDISLYGDDYYSIDTLEKGIEIANIIDKEKIMPEDMMRLVMYTYEVTIRELLTDEVINKGRELFRHADVGRSLEKYSEAYKKWHKYYSSLEPSKKASVDDTIANYKLYSRKFGKTIVTPEELKSKINRHVSNYIVENSYYFYPNYNGKDYYSRTVHATRYMDIDEIASLYKRLKIDKESRGLTGRTDEENDRIAEGRKEDLAKLQSDFARVILTRLEAYNKPKELSKMSEEEKRKYFEMGNARVAAVIVEVFNEEPMQKLLGDFDRHDLKEKGKTLVGTYEAKKSSSARVYGISKVKKAMAQITGKWSRYTMLMEKEELTEEEQKEIVSMFS